MVRRSQGFRSTQAAGVSRLKLLVSRRNFKQEENFMRILLLAAAGAALTLSACGGGDRAEENNSAMADDANMMATDNMMMDANAMNGTTDANMATDPATQNMIEQDMNTNTPDANLANGM
jgi:hypothetical protein